MDVEPWAQTGSTRHRWCDCPPGFSGEKCQNTPPDQLVAVGLVGFNDTLSEAKRNRILAPRMQSYFLGIEQKIREIMR